MNEPIWPPGYHVLSELGRGTTGIVYRAQELTIQRPVALKMPLPCPEAEQPARHARFLREVRVLASLEHENIVPVYLVAEHRGSPYYLRGLIDGDTFEHHVRAKSIDLRTGLCLLQQVAEAVAVAHAHGFAHRNLLPSNVLIEDKRARRRRTLRRFTKCSTGSRRRSANRSRRT